MKLLRAALLAMIVAALLATTVLAAPNDPFKGNWKSIDVDGSRQSLAIGGHADWRNVTLRDNYATACGGGTVIGKGDGTVAGSALSVTFELHCANGTPLADTPYTFFHDSLTGTLTDAYGVVWSRP